MAENNHSSKKSHIFVFHLAMNISNGMNEKHQPISVDVNITVLSGVGRKRNNIGRLVFEV